MNVDDNRQPNPCYTHYAFSVSPDDFDAMSQRIIQSGAKVFKDNTSSGDSLYFFDLDQHKLEIHVSSWQERVVAKKADPGAWKNIEWYI